MKQIGLVLILVLMFISCSVQQVNNTVVKKETTLKSNPKLVVGIVVDQMRYDYLTRFWDKYGDGGFKRMIREGFTCKNNHFNYIPTKTGPGHASVFTGTTPATHGIIANDWYDKEEKRSVYCAGDDAYASVGVTGNAGKMSPHRLLTTTVTDELRLASQMRGKVIGISVKDRGAVLPAGRLGNHAFWFYGRDKGIWISSTYYGNELPAWVQSFNESGIASTYKKDWNTIYDIKNYIESASDNNTFERKFNGENHPVFPHRFTEIWDANGGYNLLRESPFGNSLTTDFAIASISGEHLGADQITDFLAVSYSCTDYVGHRFGVQSKEIEDTYIRLDKDLERFFNALDAKVGKGKYTVFLTADHGGTYPPPYLKQLKLQGEFQAKEPILKKLKEYAQFKYGTPDIVENFSNEQIFLNRDLIREYGEKPCEVQRVLADELLSYPEISEVYTRCDMVSASFTDGMAGLLQKGFNQKRSGDLLITLGSGTITISEKWTYINPTDHKTGYNYDTHVPLLFFGHGINRGSTTRKTEIHDIAPTISALLGIAFPSGTSGQPISEVID